MSKDPKFKEHCKNVGAAVSEPVEVDSEPSPEPSETDITIFPEAYDAARDGGGAGRDAASAPDPQQVPRRTSLLEHKPVHRVSPYMMLRVLQIGRSDIAFSTLRGLLKSTGLQRVDLTWTFSPPLERLHFLSLWNSVISRGFCWK